MLKQSLFFTSLCFKKEISFLFEKGGVYKSPFFRVVYLFTPTTEEISPVKIMWPVAKKTGKAYFRNRLRRIARATFFEIFRFLFLKEQLIILNKNSQLYLAFMPYPLFNDLSFQDRVLKVSKMLKDIKYLDSSTFVTMSEFFVSNEAIKS